MYRLPESPDRMPTPRPARQQGAVILMVCFLLLLLLGFMGIALDFGHMFIVKTELQTAMDSCALAAAQELDGQATALPRARSAGLTAANLNRVNLQSANWDGKGQVTIADITFKDNLYADTTAPSARYAQCSHSQNGIKMWLLHVIGAANNDVASNPGTRSVLASAVATRASAQSSCPIPVALLPKLGSSGPNYGLNLGEWVTVLSVESGGGGQYPVPGEMGWFNLDGSAGAKDTKDQLSEGGACGTKVDDTATLGTKGQKQSVAEQWNYRFGLYMQGDAGPTVNHPDYSGYAYTTSNWTTQSNARPDFLLKRAANAPIQGALQPFKRVATSGELAINGYNRRLVTVPVLSTTDKVIDFVCMFLLQPMGKPNDPVSLEFRGNAGDSGSPCTTYGMAGGVAGPLVPVLVR